MTSPIVSSPLAVGGSVPATRSNRKRKAQVSSANFGTLSTTVCHRIWEMLVIPELSIVKQLNKNFGEKIPPHLTYAMHIHNAINQSHYVYMSRLADAYSCADLSGERVKLETALFRQSLNDHDPSRRASLQATFIQNLWARQLLGQPETCVSDTELWQHHLASAHAPGRTNREVVNELVEVAKRAVWGFCTPIAVVDVKNLLYGVKKRDLLPSQYKMLEVSIELLVYSQFDGPHSAPLNVRSGSWRRCREHLATDEGRQALESLDLMGFATLIDQQQRLVVDVPHPHTDATIANNLLQLSKNPSHSPHLRALVDLTLAYQRLLNRTDAITDEMACTTLRHIASREYLRPSVRKEAIMLAGSFQLVKRCPGNAYSDHDVEMFACHCLQEPEGRKEHGFLNIYPHIWAKETLIRLKMESRSHEVALKTVCEYAKQLSTDQRCSPVQKARHAEAKAFLLAMPAENLPGTGS